jgi:cobalt/nickel transport system permease protein/cobalt/nickel transport protein
VSYYASTSPDGLNRVAKDKGFSQTQTKHHSDGSPFAGYDTSGVGDGRLSKGVAGVVGSLVVLVLAGGVTLLVRRRTADADSGDEREPVEHGGR